MIAALRANLAPMPELPSIAAPFAAFAVLVAVLVAVMLA